MNANLTITLNNMKVQIQMSVAPIKYEIYMNKLTHYFFITNCMGRPVIRNFRNHTKNLYSRELNYSWHAGET